MKEKTVTTYICDFCKKEHYCPICNGKGWYYGNDGCDTRTCGSCNGKQIIIPVIETRKFYKRVGE